MLEKIILFLRYFHDLAAVWDFSKLYILNFYSKYMYNTTHKL